MRLPLTAWNFLGSGLMRSDVVIANPFGLRVPGLVGSGRAAVDVHVVSAGFFQDAGRRELAVRVPTTHPQQCRADLECCRKLFAVTRGGVIVEQLLQCGTTETGS